MRYLSRFLEWLQNRNFKHEIICLCLMFILLLPNFYLIIVGDGSITATPLKSIVFYAVGFTYLLFGIVIIRPKIFFKITYILLPIVFLELLHISVFKRPSSVNMLISLINTDLQEATELLSGYYSLLIAFILLIGIYFFLLKNLSKNYRLTKRNKIFAILLIVLLHASLFTRYILVANDLPDENSFGDQMKYATRFYKKRQEKTFPINVGITFNKYLKYQKKLNNYQKNTKGFSFNSNSVDDLQKTIVLVIGETARAMNFSLNGYNRKTNPLLEERQDLLNFSQVYSGANSTEPSLALSFSRSIPQNSEIAFKEKSFISGFKEQGYKVFWISNQSYHTGSPTYFYIKEADSIIINHFSLDSAKSITDENLLEQFESVLQTNKSKKRLIIIHTLGSHFRYNYRYPSNFELYKPNMDKSFSFTNRNKKEKDKLINSYDNSILYTDYFLNECIDILEKEKLISTFTYLSDHGENLLDDENEMILHGASEPNLYEISIPMIIWASEEYQENYPEKYSLLKDRQNDLFSSINLPYLQWGLANINVKGSDKFDFCNKNYSEPDSIYAVGGSLVSFPKTFLKKK